MATSEQVTKEVDGQRKDNCGVFLRGNWVQCLKKFDQILNSLLFTSSVFSLWTKFKTSAISIRLLFWSRLTLQVGIFLDENQNIGDSETICKLAENVRISNYALSSRRSGSTRRLSSTRHCQVFYLPNHYHHNCNNRNHEWAAAVFDHHPKENVATSLVLLPIQTSKLLTRIATTAYITRHIPYLYIYPNISSDTRHL